MSALSASLLPLWARAGEGAAIPVIRVGFTDHAFPSSYRDPGSHKSRPASRVLTKLAPIARLSFVYDGFPWPRVQSMVRHGALDAFCTAPTAEREEFALFAPTPLLSAARAIFYRADDQQAAKIASIADMAAFRQASYFGNGWARQTFGDGLIWAQRTSDILHMIEHHRADIYVGDEQAGRKLVQSLGLTGRIAVKPAPFAGEFATQFGLRKSFPDAVQIIGRIDRAIATVRQSPDFAAIVAPYR